MKTLASSAWTRWREGTATWLRRQGSFCSETAAQDRKIVFLKVVLVGLASPRGLTVQCFPQEYFSPTPPFHFRCVGPCGQGGGGGDAEGGEGGSGEGG